MDVEDGLAGVGVGVDDGAVAAVGVPRVARDACGDEEEVAEQRLVRLTRFVQRGQVFARDDERVGRRLRVDVAEDDRAVVLENLRRGNLARHDLAEETVLFGHTKIGP